MLRFVTDEHISPRVAGAARDAFPGLEIIALRDWQVGHLLGAGDEFLLREAHGESLTLVTFDLRTIPPLLRSWAEHGIDHGGVVLVDSHSISPTDIGSLAESLGALWVAQRQLDWTNRVVFLRRVTG